MHTMRIISFFGILIIFLPTLTIGGSDKQSEAYRASVCALLPDMSDCMRVRPSHSQYTEAPKGSISIKSGVTIITKDRERHFFETIERPGFPYPKSSHHFLGYLPKHQYFVVFGIYGSGEVSRIGLVSNLTGKVVWIDGTIFISPDGNYILSIPHAPGTSVSEGVIYELTPRAVIKSAKIDFGNCPENLGGPCPTVQDAVWISPTSVVAFTLNYDKSPRLELGSFLVRISKAGNHWKTSRLKK